MSEIASITTLLKNTFDQQPWYGSSILEILSDINPEIVFQRVGASHSIIELVLHMTSWRTFATRKLMGDLDFDIDRATNFPSPTTWEAALEGLHQSQEALLEAAEDFPVGRLSEIVPSKLLAYSYYTLLHGIIHHDIYHLGQIALLKKVFS